jgi:hypothetical protein
MVAAAILGFEEQKRQIDVEIAELRGSSNGISEIVQLMPSLSIVLVGRVFRRDRGRVEFYEPSVSYAPMGRRGASFLHGRTRRLIAC